jgi:putative PIN family toxin of toxin-antitoxin system
MPKPPRVVADSNVVISAIVFGGVPEVIIGLARDGRIELYLSRFILEEIAGVLSRPKFGWQPEDIAEALRSFPYRVVATGRRRLSIARDASDNRVLECAVASKAEFLITGDRHLLDVDCYFRTRILTPRQFLVALADRD